MTPAVRRGRQVAAGRATTWPGPAPTQAAAAPALAQVPRSVQRRRSTSRPAPNNHGATSYPATTWANPRSGDRHGREPGSHPAGHSRDDPVVAGLLTQAKDGDRQAWDALRDRYAPLVWSICRRPPAGGRRRPDRLAQTRGPPGQDPRPGRAARLAGHHYPARMRPYPQNRPAIRPRRTCARRDHRRRSRPDGRAGPGRGRTVRRPARGVRAAAPRLPAAARPAHRGPASAVRRDQRQVGHPGRQNRADPPPLPGTSYAATRPSPR